MKNSFLMLKNAASKALGLLALLFLLAHVSVLAQTLTFPVNGFPVTINGAGPTVCQASVAATAENQLYSIAQVNPLWLNGSITGINLYSGNEAGYHIAQAGVPKQIIIDIPFFVAPAFNLSIEYNYGQFDNNLDATGFISDGVYVLPTNNNEIPVYRHIINITFPLGIRKGYFAFKVVRGDIFSPYPPHMMVIPFVVEGPTVQEVPSLGTTVDPQIPYMILHAPPGDGSKSTFQSSKTTCRELVDTYEESNSNTLDGYGKLGSKGSIGLVVNIDYEFFVKFKAGASDEAMQIKTNSNQTCITMNEEFEASALDGLYGDGDVFIGFGTDLEYGIYPRLLINQATCASKMDTGLVYFPVGNPRRFALTKIGILSEIETLEATVADSANVGPKVANNAQNQIDVWKQVLAMNEDNINDPNNVSLGSITFDHNGGSYSSGISVVNTNSIEFERYLEVSAGIETAVEIGGSGIGFGYEYKAGKRFGATDTQSSGTEEFVGYTLADNDTGDKYLLNVVRDRMYGTPVFRILPGTKTSCPYQGGYQRDQPVLKHAGQTSDHITLLGTPVNQSATFNVDVCNTSNEARTYKLKLNPNSNLNGAVVTAAGLPLNNAFGQDFTVPANGCLVSPLVIEVKMQSVNSPLSYPNLELILEPSCADEENISSSIFASVYFGNATSVDNPSSNISQLTLYPNPASDVVNVAFDLKQAAPARFELIDLLGSTHYTEDMDLPSGANQHRLDTANLPGGIYILKMQCGSAQLSKKLVIEK